MYSKVISGKIIKPILRTSTREILVSCDEVIIEGYSNYAQAMLALMPEEKAIEEQVQYLTKIDPRKAVVLKEQLCKSISIISALDGIVEAVEIKAVIEMMREIDQAIKQYDFDEHKRALLGVDYFQESMLKCLKKSKELEELIDHIREEYTNGYSSFTDIHILFDSLNNFFNERLLKKVHILSAFESTITDVFGIQGSPNLQKVTAIHINFREQLNGTSKMLGDPFVNILTDLIVHAVKLKLAKRS